LVLQGSAEGSYLTKYGRYVLKQQNDKFDENPQNWSFIEMP